MAKRFMDFVFPPGHAKKRESSIVLNSLSKKRIDGTSFNGDILVFTENNGNLHIKCYPASEKDDMELIAIAKQIGADKNINLDPSYGAPN